jgi:hypothetical protein
MITVSDAGHGQVERIRNDLRTAAASGAAFDVMAVQLDTLTDELVAGLQA